MCHKVTYPTLLQEILKELRDFVKDSEVTASPDENNKSQDAAKPCEDPPSKRAKLEPGTRAVDGDAAETPEPFVCVACLGVLQELSDASQAKKIAEAVKAEAFEFDSLVLSISLPAQLGVREVSPRNVADELIANPARVSQN